MNTLELQNFLDANNARKISMVVCAIDEIKEKYKKNQETGFVVNLSRSSESGSHWIGLYIKNNNNSKKKKNNYCVYFDSYAFPPRSCYLKEFISENCNKFNYNEKPVQQITSNVCGMYAACFILHLANGGSLLSYTGKFSKNLLLNDLFIRKNYDYYLRNSHVRKLSAIKKLNLTNEKCLKKRKY